MLLRGGLSVEGIHQIVAGFPALHLVTILQGQSLTFAQGIEQGLTTIDTWGTSSGVDITGIECSTTKGVEYPPVDILMYLLGVVKSRRHTHIVKLCLVEHVEPLAIGSHRRLDTIDGTTQCTIIADDGLALLTTLSGYQHNA